MRFQSIAVGSILASLVTPWASGFQTLHETLVQSTGQAYLNARNEALGLPAGERAALVNELRAPEASLESRVTGLFLATRIENPALAHEFDDNLTIMLANPIPKRVAGEFAYKGGPIMRLNDAHPLMFEVVHKLDVPLSLKKAIAISMTSDGVALPVDLEPLLLLLDQQAHPQLRRNAVAAVGRLATHHSDPRIAPALKELYVHERTAKPDCDPSAIDIPHLIGLALEYDGTPGALQAILEIIQFEENLMTQEGFTPWNDPNAVQLAMDAATAAGHVHGRTIRENRQPTPAEQAILQDHEAKSKRMNARLLWERLLKTRDKLLAELEPDPPPP